MTSAQPHQKEDMNGTVTPSAPDSPSSFPASGRKDSTAPVVTGRAHPRGKGQDRPSGPDPGPRGHIGRIVAGSLATGLGAALLLVAVPFTPAQESEATGAVLFGFALGWAMLAMLSVRFTDQPQRWAAAPRCSWDSAVFSCWGSAPRCTRCSTGCGPLPCWR